MHYCSYLGRPLALFTDFLIEVRALLYRKLMFQVLTLKDGNDEYRTEVQLQDKKSPNHTEDQKWYRKWWNTFDSDYFVLIGGQTQRLLTAEGTEKLFIGGKLFVLLMYLCFIHCISWLIACTSAFQNLRIISFAVVNMTEK